MSECTFLSRLAWWPGGASLIFCLLTVSSKDIIESNSSPVLFKGRGTIEISGKSYHTLLRVSVQELVNSLTPIGDSISQIDTTLNETLTRLSPSRRAHKLALEYNLANRSLDSFDSLTVALNSHMRDHMSFLMADLVDKHQQLHSFILTLDKNDDSQPRTKRGAVNAGGSVLKWLFGVATEDDVIDTQQLVDKVTTLAEKTRVQLNLHSEILNTTAVNFAKVDDHMAKLTQCLNQVKGNIEAIATIVTGGQENSYTLAHAIILTNSLTYASSAIQDLSNQFMNLKMGLNKFKSGFLSPEIVPPSTILNLIDVITRKNLKPMYPSATEYIPMLYRFIKVEEVPARPLTYIISIPLLGDPRLNLKLYEVYNMPHPVSDTLTITYSGIPNFLAVSDDHRLYQSFADMHSCRSHGTVYLCNTDFPVYRDEAPSCVLNLFRGVGDDVCERHFSGPLKRPLIIKSTIGWLYSVSSDEEVSITCPSNTTRVTIKTGSGIINTNSDCKLSGKKFILPSEAQPRGQTIEFRASLVSPFKVSLTNDEINKIDIVENSEILSNIMVLNNNKLPLSSLKSEVKNLAYIKKMREINSITANTGMALSSISFIGVILIIVFLICLYIVARDRKKREHVVNFFSNAGQKQQQEGSERLVIREELEVDTRRPDTLELPPIDTSEVRRPVMLPRSPIPTERHTKVISQDEHFDSLQTCQ